MRLAKLSEPGKIKTMVVRNRTVMAPMVTQYADDGGYVTDRMIDFYVARAKGGVGLIDTQIIFPSRDWYLGGGLLGIWDDSFIPGLKRLTSAVQAHGAKIAFQLFHPGPEAKRLAQVMGGHELENLGASSFTLLATNESVRGISKEEMRRIIEAFGQAAGRLKRAGTDAISFHGGHGYLISSFLSPSTNKRTDEYGGSPENRARFACELLQRMRQEVGPNFPLIMRMNGADFIKHGLTIEEAMRQAPLLEEAGADALNVSGSAREGTHYQWIPFLSPSAGITHLAAAIKKVVKIPVITVGKIGDPYLAEKILQEGRADFICMGRQLLADPEWPNKAKEDRFDDILLCIYCNQGCLGESGRQLYHSTTCLINPACGREKEFELKPAPKTKKVIVIGGGLAGMEAARIAAQRGHQVSLYEKSDKLGGQWNIAAIQDYKEDYGRVVQQRSRWLQQAGAKVHLNQEVSRKLLEELKPDAVVVATGATPLRLNIPGADNPIAVQAVDVITGKAPVGEKAIVVGGNTLGMEVALSLAEKGKKVILLEARNRIGPEVQYIVRRVLMNKLLENDVNMYTNFPVVEMLDDGVHVIDTTERGGELRFFPADTVVLAVGAKAENRLVAELKGTAPEVHAIGDCVQARDALFAIHEGANMGLQL